MMWKCTVEALLAKSNADLHCSFKLSPQHFTFPLAWVGLEFGIHNAGDKLHVMKMKIYLFKHR